MTHTRSADHSFHTLIAKRLSRRDVLRGSSALTAIAASGHMARAADVSSSMTASPSTLTFTDLKRVYDETHHVAEGYRAEVLIRWGDKVLPGAPEFDPTKQSLDSQSQQFGYNCDHIGYFPLPYGAGNTDKALLAINHEYPGLHIMFPGLVTLDEEAGKVVSKEQVDVGLASIGLSVVEIEKKDGKWTLADNSVMNRRITGFTEFTISGPAAGHALMKTSADATGTRVLGMSTNCAGGVTPWGTVLTCEEWSGSFFGGDPAKTSNKEGLERAGAGNEDYFGAARFYDRFNVEKEPNEFNRFLWVVEIDPYEPSSPPIKRTALGRFGHEGAATVVNKDGRVVVYLGDDDYFEYVYRFVSKGAYNAADRKANMSLLDEGTLSVAKFEEGGKLTWMPLVQGQGPLTAENGFPDQATVLINARLAGDKLGATKMDRPEDFEVSPVSGRIYCAMTKNSRRKADDLNPANPRAENRWGHIVELIPSGFGADADHTADTYNWDLLVLAGDPGKPEVGATFNGGTTPNGWFATPDNLAMDGRGRLWVATDGQNDFDMADGIFGMDVQGPGRGLSKALFACPLGAEATGPEFAPDDRTLFISIQHPGENSENIDKLTTRWPDFKDGMPPRPSVVVITQADGGEIGS